MSTDSKDPRAPARTVSVETVAPVKPAPSPKLQADVKADTNAKVATPEPPTPPQAGVSRVGYARCRVFHGSLQHNDRTYIVGDELELPTYLVDRLSGVIVRME